MTRASLDKTPVIHIPDGYGAVTPWMISRSTDQLIKFITEAFDGKESSRVLNRDGSIGHSEIRIGDSVVMLFDSEAAWPDTPAFLRIFVEDADATYKRALECGATSVTEVSYLFFGDRVGRVCDPLGNLWWIQSHVEDVDPSEMQRRSSDKRYMDAMAYVQGTLSQWLSENGTRIE